MSSTTSSFRNNGLRAFAEAAQLRLAPPSLGAVPLETTFAHVPAPEAEGAAATPTAPARRLSANAAFYLQASITVAFLAGSSAPSPLYPIYQAAWGFSSLAITVIFGVYAFAVLVALLIAGRGAERRDDRVRGGAS